MGTSAAFQRRRQPLQEDRVAQIGGLRQRQHRRQPQPADDRHRGRQHRGDIHRVRMAPGEALAFQPARLAFPAGDAPEVQPHPRVRIDVVPQHPRRLFRHRDAQFLVQFADQRGLGGFAGFDLAARKFPQARHGLAFRALCQKHAPVGVDQRDGGNKNRLHDR